MRTLPGYDPMGTVHDAGDAILRRVAPRHREAVLGAYRLFETHRLARLGVVATAAEPATLGGELVLRHPKLVISYPHEWPAAMLREAALLQLELVAALDPWGYTLKDALPGNVLFDFSRPVFVDFFSLVPTASLAQESWLGAPAAGRDARFTVLKRMFVPYYLVPLLRHVQREHDAARRLLFERGCNVSLAAPGWRDLLPASLHATQRALPGLLGATRYALAVRRGDFLEACRRIRALVAGLAVRPAASAYRSYYEDKAEDFPPDAPETWRAKQRGVAAVLERLRPGRVLDLGANTGWFSLLAARGGAEVIATDVDEAAVDRLWRRAAADRLRILPLTLPFGDLSAARDGLDYAGEAAPGHSGGRPLLLPATERLRADLVLCLALVHHLALGEGRSLESIFDVLALLATRALVVEYVARDDALIRAEPGFFPHLAGIGHEAYGLEQLLAAGKRRFAAVEVLDSHPASRKLLVFTSPR